MTAALHSQAKAPARQSIQIHSSLSGLESRLARADGLEEYVALQRKPLSVQPPLVQAKLTVGPPEDEYEREADSVAEQVMSMPQPRVQRKGEEQEDSLLMQEKLKLNNHEDMGTQDGTVPISVERVLASSGRPLEMALQKDMAQCFGHDFSHVRVHSGEAAERSAREMNANAYTSGQNIVFGEGRFEPGTHEGRRLIAHELAHVLQQATAGAATTLRAQPNKKPSPKKPKPKIPKICGRPSRKVSDNSITKINIDVGANTLTIEWKDQTKIPPGSEGTHFISPGAGLCCVDCNDETLSQKSGKLCTPKGGEWPVAFTRCALSGYPTAKNPTYFQRSGVAIHSGNTSEPPKSHGCVRTDPKISELIHDNVIPEETLIASSGTWNGKKCYLKETSKALSNRKDVCDGNKLKSKNKGKKDKKQNNKPNASEETPMEQTPNPAQPPLVQARLKIGQPNDAYEQETGRVADQAMSMLEQRVQRQSDEEKVAFKLKAVGCALTTYKGSNFVGDTVTADEEFIESLRKINNYATANNVNIHITNSFREAGGKIKGAIVSPAKMSNHLAGHAIDMNVWHGEKKDKLCSSKCLKGELPADVSGFIADIRKDKCLRWGGDFKPSDPVHLDDGLNKDKEAWKARYNATQIARKSGCG